MPIEEKLPTEVQGKIPEAQELLKLVSSKVPSLPYPPDVAIYVAAKLAGLNPDTVYADYYESDADETTLKGLIARCIGVASIIDGMG